MLGGQVNPTKATAFFFGVVLTLGHGCTTAGKVAAPPLVSAAPPTGGIRLIRAPTTAEPVGEIESDLGQNETESHVLSRRFVGVMRAACGDARPEMLGSRPGVGATMRTRFACHATPSAEARDVAAQRDERESTARLRFGVIDTTGLGALEAQNSMRAGGRYWEFVLAYRNTTGAIVKPLGVECMTLLGTRILNANKRVEWDGVPAGGFVVFKVPVEDAGDAPDYGSCRLFSR